MLMGLEIALGKKEPCRKVAHRPGAHMGKIGEMESQEITSQTSQPWSKGPWQSYGNCGHVYARGWQSGGSGLPCAAAMVGP